MMTAFRQDDAPLILFELGEANGALGDANPEKRELELDFAVLCHATRVDRYEAGQEGRDGAWSCRWGLAGS